MSRVHPMIPYTIVELYIGNINLKHGDMFMILQITMLCINNVFCFFGWSPLILYELIMSYPDDGILDDRSGGSSCAIGSICKVGTTRTTMDENMQFVWQILQSSWGRNRKRGYSQSKYGCYVLYFGFQPLSPLRRKQEQKWFKVVVNYYNLLHYMYVSNIHQGCVGLFLVFCTFDQ